MRLSTVALSLMALGLTCVAAVPSTSAHADEVPVARDFERKMQVRDPRKHLVARDTLYTDGKLTWYGGGQLDNPACGGSTPSKWDHVVAVKEGGSFKCGDTIHIHHGGKMESAKVVDYCSGCASHHLDLTQGLFEKFASLSTGELTGAHLRLMG